MLAAKYAERAFSYLWVQGRVQTALEAAVGVGGSAPDSLCIPAPSNDNLCHSFSQPYASDGMTESCPLLFLLPL